MFAFGFGNRKIYETYCTGCIKKKVIELQRAIIRELLGGGRMNNWFSYSERSGL